MEIFIFPELLYSLVLANCMSPIIWRWREDSWFRDIHKMNEYQRIQRVKQFIMDRFVFNLDLDTWGLTTKERELVRFRDFMTEDVLAQSNALFGYEGDKYYFDIDIRRHFGLDKYTSDVIPYWKTESLEAMEAFRFRDGYTHGAGECVSLSTLYAATLCVVAEIPLEKIHLLATPLHSQNFIDVKEGIITNNRRIVTKNMWFNGTEISAKARRALENERVTMIVNNTGYVHAMYPEATMSREVYEQVTAKMQEYLKTKITFEVLVSFLRVRNDLQKNFQFSTVRNGKTVFIGADVVFHYEHSSKSRAGSGAQKALMLEIDQDEFYPEPLESCILLDEMEIFFKKNQLLSDQEATKHLLTEQLSHCCDNVAEVVSALMRFACVKLDAPNPTDKKWISTPSLLLNFAAGRDAVLAQIYSLRGSMPIADLAISAFRDMAHSPWKPFLKAACERNPVSYEALSLLSVSEIVQQLSVLPDHSIYEESFRIAQPDEVWNFGRGDGLEKAILLASVIVRRGETIPTICIEAGTVTVEIMESTITFVTSKQVSPIMPEDMKFL